MPDHFDRLLAKSDPDRAGVRVRPRLPGPFERIEPLGPTPPPVDKEPGAPERRPAPAPLPRPSAEPRPPAPPGEP
ncbi:hypothetical protein ACFXAM_30560, partial [Kitasatospora sp. NPDC059462]